MKPRLIPLFTLPLLFYVNFGVDPQEEEVHILIEAKMYFFHHFFFEGFPNQ